MRNTDRQLLRDLIDDARDECLWHLEQRGYVPRHVEAHYHAVARAVGETEEPELQEAS